jgi:transcriptional regulator with XRE-family HTH domain
MLKLGDRIRRAREAQHWSRAELARRVGVSASATVQWEQSDGTTPSVDHLFKIAEQTRVSFEWLTTGRGSPSYIGDETAAVDVTFFALTLFEEELLDLSRKLPRKSQQAFLQFLRTVVASKQTARRIKPAAALKKSS